VTGRGIFEAFKHTWRAMCLISNSMLASPPVLIAAVGLPVAAALAAVGLRSKDIRHRPPGIAFKFDHRERVTQWDLVKGFFRHGAVCETSPGSPELYRVRWDGEERDPDWHSALTLYREARFNPED
jgi:hypothetical protein